MKINLRNAVGTFYPNPSHEQIYFEAVANALDAGATQITINIQIDEWGASRTTVLSIKDNGAGIGARQFEKFSSLLEVENKDHKGLGRLVYLAYFDEVEVSSVYRDEQGSKKQRLFTFTKDFEGEAQVTTSAAPLGTILKMKGYVKSKLANYDFIRPEVIIQRIQQEFFPRFFYMKQKEESLRIKVDLHVVHPGPRYDLVSSEEEFTLDKLPDLHEVGLPTEALGLGCESKIYYSIDPPPTWGGKTSMYVGICVDSRAIEYDLIQSNAVPNGYQLRFLLQAECFRGMTNPSRQILELPEDLNKRTFDENLRDAIGQIIEREIPAVGAENTKVLQSLNERYPHLAGFFPSRPTGLIVRSSVLEAAQMKLFSEQKQILECEALDDSQYQKAIELSSRTLAEYILYRSQIIAKLKATDEQSSEADLHKIIVPMKRKISGQDFEDHIYSNNVWLLDDRFMSFTTIFSDRRMEELIREITGDEVSDSGRPDIAVVFSSDPHSSDRPVSVVIVEIKKHGVKLAQSFEAAFQLRERAQRLLRYFPSKIEKLWFYGIVDIETDFELVLRDYGFNPLFSHGQVFFNHQKVSIALNTEPLKVDVFVMSYEALIADAESRNNTFLKVLRHSIQQIAGQS